MAENEIIKDALIQRKEIRRMSDEEIEKSGSSGKEIVKIYDSMLPDLISKNLELQKRALRVIEEKIDSASAAQAATIYGILSDKTTNIMGKSAQTGNTINMFFTDVDSVNGNELMEKVLLRAKEKKSAIEVKAVESKEEE